MSATSAEEPPDRKRAYKNVQGAFKDVHQLNAFPGFSDNDLMTCLSMKYGYSTVLAIAKTMQRVRTVTLCVVYNSFVCAKFSSTGTCMFNVCLSHISHFVLSLEGYSNNSVVHMHDQRNTKK